MDLVKKGIGTLALLLLASVFIFPFLWMVSTSLKSLIETTHFPPSLLPEQFLFENFRQAFHAINFFTSARNSLIIVVGVLIAQIIVVIPAAYALAFKNMKWGKFFFGLIMVGIMVPQQVTFVPIFFLFSELSLINTYTALIIPFAASAFGIFMITQSFKQIPKDVIEAARLDKSGELKIIWRILLPAARPMIVCFMMFSIISRWNDFFWPTIMTNIESMRTLSMAITRLTPVDGIRPWNIIMAANLIFISPLLVLYIFCNKWIKTALAYSGVK